MAFFSIIIQERRRRKQKIDDNTDICLIDGVPTVYIYSTSREGKKIEEQHNIRISLEGC